MDTLSLIVVSDETSPVRRFELRKQLLKRAAIGAGIFVFVLLALSVDYVRLRIDNRELASLREETRQRREQVAAFEKAMSQVDGTLSKVQEFERKVRIIANLPGSAASGGEEVTAVGSDADEEDLAPGGQGGLDEPGTEDAMKQPADRLPHPKHDASIEDRVSLLKQAAEYLGVVAEGQATSLEELVSALEGKHHYLASSPSIWPAKGWLTSRYGYRISPFTGKKQFHAGIDIAGAYGTDVVAPADGTVVFAGKRGPLGNCLIIDHGYGVRTEYGHTKEILVKRGDKVERGEKIALMGNTGRSTGPHLHYVVEINGKTRNPLDYIFD
jgi:biotin carboxyl carrier protein